MRKYHTFKDGEELKLKLENRKNIKKEKSNTTYTRKHGKNLAGFKYKAGIKQMCSVMAKYRISKDLHNKNLKYIQKEGKGQFGEKPELYGDVDTYEKNMVEKNWRIQISPDKANTDLTLLTKEYIKKLEQTTGYKFRWVASNHYDTAHPHTHILINGIDKQGRDVKFQKEIIRVKMIDYARDICTTMHGYRTQSDMQRYYENCVDNNRYTQLDKIIEQKIENKTVELKSIINSAKGEILNRRLSYLETLNLCQFDSDNHEYKMKDNWKSELQMYGKYNSYLEGFKYSGVSIDKYNLHSIEKNGAIKGTVLKKFTMQNNSNDFALLIKTKEGNVKYVPLKFYSTVEKGDYVNIVNKDKKVYVNTFKRQSH